MSSSDELLENYKSLLAKSLKHLKYSFDKVQTLPPVSDDSKEEELESWESFSSRFARSSDLFVSKVLRRLILTKDPAYRGSVIDLLQEAEKYSWIRDAMSWRRIRQLQNIAAHEYTIEDLAPLYNELLSLTPIILELGSDAKI